MCKPQEKQNVRSDLFQSNHKKDRAPTELNVNLGRKDFLKLQEELSCQVAGQEELKKFWEEEQKRRKVWLNLERQNHLNEEEVKKMVYTK